MESFNVDEFIRKVKVEKEYDSDTCEYEVTKMAMEFYLKYPCYKEWGIFLHGDSIGNYMRDKEQKRDKEDYRGNGSYIGAHLLKETEGNKVLTADILTSINSPVSLCERNLKEEEISQCRSYFKAFEIVYYWCGNMLPVICSFSPGNPDISVIDNWKAKLDLLYKFSGEGSSSNRDFYYEFLKGKGKCHKQNQLWSGWIANHWKNNMENFIRQNYLRDCVQNSSTKKIADGMDGANFKSIVKNDSSDIELVKIWFINNTKLVIQRSYRILNNIENDFNKEQKDHIKQVFKRIFSEAQISDDEIVSCLF